MTSAYTCNTAKKSVANVRAACKAATPTCYILALIPLRCNLMTFWEYRQPHIQAYYYDKPQTC